MTYRYLMLWGGLLMCGVFLRSVVMPMPPAVGAYEVIIERDGQIVAPAAPSTPIELPCEQEPWTL